MAADRDATPHAPGRLEAALRAGRFAITTETTPPDSADPEALLAPVRPLAGLVDAVNVTDGAAARAHMAALPAAAILVRAGIEPVLQVTARDRNRIAIQGDLLGAAALGIPNILCLRGDDPSVGDQPETKDVNDLDSRTMLETARCMRDESAFPSGRPIARPPRLFLGAADAPFEPPPEWRPDALAAKIDAGADFLQTQFCFDLGVLRRYLDRLDAHGLLGRVYILVGVGAIASAASARWMNENLPGVTVPEAIVERLEDAAEPGAEGRRICAELVAELQEIPGVHGAHIMGPRCEEAVPEVLALAGLGAPAARAQT